MKKSIQLIAAPTILCVVAGFLLAWAHSVTKAPIERARKAEMIAALRKVLPECDNDVLADVKVFKDNKGQAWTFHIARLKGSYVGTAFLADSRKGYGGAISTLVGVRADATVNGIEIISADKETPGLGAKVRERFFRCQFTNRSALDLAWDALTKDGGQINAITGATISSRAVTAAVRTGLQIFASHAAEISGAAK